MRGRYRRPVQTPRALSSAGCFGSKCDARRRDECFTATPYAGVGHSPVANESRWPHSVHRKVCTRRFVLPLTLAPDMPVQNDGSGAPVTQMEGMTLEKLLSAMRPSSVPAPHCAHSTFYIGPTLADRAA